MEVVPCYGGATLPQHTSSVWSDVRVLIVDSDAQNLMNVKRMFEQCGYNKVAYLQTTEDALWLLQHSPVDLLLCQAFLPNDIEGGGFQLLSAVKQDIKFRDLQVVLYSGHHQDDDVMGLGYEMGIRALELGACAFYSNPISMEVVRHLWQHVFLRKIQSCGIIPPQQQPIWNVQRPESYNNSQVSSEKSKKKSDKDDGVELMVKSRRMKKKKEKERMRWTEDLDRKFAAAIDEIRRSDPNGVTASRIRGLMKGMGEEGLTIPQINSHLQKYNKEKRSSCVDSVDPAPQQVRDGDGVAAACGENDSSSVAQQEWSDADLQELLIMDTSELSQLLLILD